MYYCVASLRKLSEQGRAHEFAMSVKGQTKGEALAELYKSGAVIIWFEEISQEDYEIVKTAKENGEFSK